MSARDDIVQAVHEGYETLDWAPSEQEIDELLARHVAEVLAERGDRRRIIGEVTAALGAHNWGPCVCLDTVDWVLDELRRMAET